MNLSDKLQILRKSNGITQEALAERLQVSRQAVAKWENGMTYPDIMNLIQLSEIFHITIDYLVKDQECNKSIIASPKNDLGALIEFKLEALKHTYAGYAETCHSSRPSSHDYVYEKDNRRIYLQDESNRRY